VKLPALWAGSFTEADPTPGFALTAITCDDGNSTSDVGTRTATFRLEAGETVRCTFTNTLQQGTVIVRKVMVGGTDTFTFTGTPSGSISANNGTIQATVAPGQYQSTEAVPVGWVLSNIVCDDGNSTGDVGTATATFNVEAGETVTCTFTNTKQGTITIIKDAVPNDPQDFEFSRSFGANFFLDDDADPTLPNTVTFANLNAGAYTVTELGPPAGWQLTNLVCNDPDGGTTVDLGTRTVNIDLDAGETVTCTFTNTLQQADLSITKADNPDPVQVGQQLTYTLTVRNNGPNDGTNVTATDTLPAGVTFVSATASQGTCNQAAGTVTCNLGTINNGAQATITIVVQPENPGQITNTAQVQANEQDPDPNNNNIQQQTTVNAPVQVITGTATAFDRTGRPIATVQLDSPVPQVVPRFRGWKYRTDCQSQGTLQFCRTLPKGVRRNQVFWIIQRVKNIGAATLARVRMEDTLPPNVQLVSGKLVRECRNLRKNQICTNMYKAKVIAGSANPGQMNELQVRTIEGPPAGSGALTFLAQGEGIRDIRVAIFDLSGRLAFDSDWVPNGFVWHSWNIQGKPLANGVYLYVVRVRGFNEEVYVSEVRKLVIVR
jgi:uncharacterized repeat protein (TIGR01451 family)